MSTLEPGSETNAGRAYKLLREANPSLSIYYEAGVQWRSWRSAPDVMMGRGINRQIRRAYGFLASRYRPGDRIFFLGYSRGAYAVRSLAGAIDQVGLLKSDYAVERHIQTVYRIYQSGLQSAGQIGFVRSHCHETVPIEMVGVWDTVKALGIRLPLLWRWSERNHEFHNHALGASVQHGFHALAHDETRVAYAPVLWDCPGETQGRVEQVWFPGTHGDVGGQLTGFEAARPLANIPLVWMLERAESCGLDLPDGWRVGLPQDPLAPSASSWSGFGKLFLLRGKRNMGARRCERVHHSVHTRLRKVPSPRTVTAQLRHAVVKRRRQT